MLLSKRPYGSWREIQVEHPDYKASLGPFLPSELLDFLASDFGDDDARWPFRKSAITDFLHSPADTLLSKDL